MSYAHGWSPSRQAQIAELGLPYSHQGQPTVPFRSLLPFLPPHPPLFRPEGKTPRKHFFPGLGKTLRDPQWFQTFCATLSAKLFCKIKCYWVCFWVECSWGPLAILPILSQVLPVACCCLLSTAVGSQGSHRLQVLLLKPEPVNLPAECLEPRPTAEAMGS
jgi:hypothetical protein